MDWWKEKKKKKEKNKGVLVSRDRGAMLLEDVINCCDGKSNPIKFFSADLILKATNIFGESNNVFQLFNSDWYSGVDDNNRMILNKKLTKINSGSSFCRDVAISSMVSGHKNFMKLAGCCLELEDPVMVYYGEKKQYSNIDFEKIVSWKKRMKIAEDIATALAYLHTAFSTPFVFRILGIEEIFIDKDGVAKLNNFSYCISIPIGERFVQVDGVVGTVGYLDSNYISKCIVSEKTDTYGFGTFMVMLLMGGRERFDEFQKTNCCDDDILVYNPDWMAKIIEEGRLVDEIIDPKMLEDMGEVTAEERYRMNAFLFLSFRCSGCKGEVPTMVEVAKELKEIQRSSQNATAAASSSSSPSSSSSSSSPSSSFFKALQTCLICQVFDDILQWVILRWFFRKRVEGRGKNKLESCSHNKSVRLYFV